MKLNDNLVKTGEWLFKKRGVFPFLILPVVALALRQAEGLERVFGTPVQSFWEVLCITISFSGLIVRAVTVGWVPEGTSGRNTQGQLADYLNTEGIYSIVRHPLYLGNFLITFGMILFIQVWWLAAIFILSFWLFYERIMMAEEDFLEKKFGAVFTRWSETTSAFFPNFSQWRNPRLPFSMRMVLKREYSTFFGIITAFVLIKFLAELLASGHVRFHLSWLIFFTIGLSVYLTLRTLRKKTRLLHVDAESRRPVL